MENFNLNGFPTRLAPSALLLLLLPSPYRRLCAVAHLSERRAPFKTLYILKSFSIQWERGLGSSKNEKPGASFSNFITRFWTVGNQQNKETKILIV